MKRGHLVVDGSNIATEGRTAPSLAQLDEAVRSFLEEYDVKVVTVVVDATFGHRIDPAEAPAYEEAILNGELVTPPAGAIGRGDAFILGVADRASATVLSNDSFQEFHGQYPWLFDEGRLIGGKPVPNVGWVFVPRAPVRGPTSRRSIRDAKKVASKATAAKPAKTTPAKKAAKATAVPSPAPTEVAAPAASEGVPRRRRRTSSSAREPLNEQRTYALFVIDHPVGSVIEGVVDRFSSHGAYIRVGEAQCYVPLRSLGDPPPRSAREVLNLGETRSFVVQRFDPDRKGIDVAPADGLAVQAERGRATAAEAVATAAGTSKQETDAREAPVSPVAKKKAPARKAPAKKAPAKKKAPARKAPAKKAPARKAPARKAPAKKAPARKAPAKKAPAKKAPARRAPAKKAAAKRAPARKKAPARRTAAKKR